MRVRRAAPHDVRMTAPQLSEDGRWWWDGVRWWPAVTVEGNWRFDGVEWRRVGGRWGLALGFAGVGIAAMFVAVLAFAVAMVLGLTDWGLSDEPTPGWVGPTLHVAWYGFWLGLMATAGCFLGALLALLIPRR